MPTEVPEGVAVKGFEGDSLGVGESTKDVNVLELVDAVWDELLDGSHGFGAPDQRISGRAGSSVRFAQQVTREGVELL